MAQAWLLAPVALMSVLVVLLRLLALPEALLWCTRVVAWAGIGPWIQGALGGFLGGRAPMDLVMLWLPALGMALEVALYLALIAVFVPYAGWLGVLVRTRTFSQAVQGGKHGSS